MFLLNIKKWNHVLLKCLSKWYTVAHFIYAEDIPNKSTELANRQGITYKTCIMGPSLVVTYDKFHSITMTTYIVTNVYRLVSNCSWVWFIINTMLFYHSGVKFTFDTTRTGQQAYILFTSNHFAMISNDLSHPMPSPMFWLSQANLHTMHKSVPPK